MQLRLDLVLQTKLFLATVLAMAITAMTPTASISSTVRRSRRMHALLL